jgi:Ni/Fe-hydrogenase subunit HybB-like protein
MLPVNFYVTAVAVGFAMVIFEATLSSRAFGLPVEEDALAGLGRILKYCLLVYLVIRMVDLFINGALPLIASRMGILFSAEMLLGVVIPMVLLFNNRFRTRVWPRFTAAALVIFGLIFNRFNVTLYAMNRPGEGSYFPAVEEIIISMSIVCALIFFYNLMVKVFPVLPKHEEDLVGISHGESGGAA